MTKVKFKIPPTAAQANSKVRRLPLKEPTVRYRPIILAGALIGFGMGALFDGILLREVFQWHAIASAHLPVMGVAAPIAAENLRINLFWNGMYGLFAWIVTAAGIARLWQAGFTRHVAWSARVFCGSALCAWGMFQVLDSVMAYLVPLHHVRDTGNAAIWDTVYLLFGVALLIAGYMIARPDLARARSHANAR